jgi:hypothetical protein
MAERMHRFDWDTEDAYWRTNYRTRPYAASQRSRTICEPNGTRMSTVGNRRGNR